MESLAMKSKFKYPAGYLRGVETSLLVPLGTCKLNLRQKRNSIGMIKLPSKINVKLCKCKLNVSSSMIPSRSNNCNEDEKEEGNNKFKKGRGWIHFVGVGGSGLSAIAMIALKQGFEVSGSDKALSSYMDPLRAAGAHLFVGHSESNLQNPDGGLGFPDAVVMSSAIPPDNLEILYAKSAGIPVYKRGAWLGKLTEDYNLIAVSGTHGKSTTTSMIAYVLRAMGDDLTAIIGAQVPQFSGMNAIFGTSPSFILEADEYDGCFLELSPHIAVVTNVEWEHVDMYPDEEAVISTFKRFIGKIRSNGHLILCGDCSGASSLLRDKKVTSSSTVSNGTELCQPSNPHSNSYNVTTYGVSEINEWNASSICSNTKGGTDYKLCHRGHHVADITLQIPGVHNVLNSLAVIASICAIIGEKQFYESIGSIKLHLNNFKGVSRRFEMIGQFYGCQIYDDYAHHPSEVSAVLQAARQKFPNKEILVIFQPHSYSRLAALKNIFLTVFSHANQVIVTEIYPGRETNLLKISARDLAVSIKGPLSEFIPSLMDVVNKLLVEVTKDPNREIVILTLGAGDVTMVGRELFNRLQKTGVAI